MSGKLTEKIAEIWKKVSILSKKIPLGYYVAVFFVLVIFVANEVFLWQKSGDDHVRTSYDMRAKEVDDFVISAAKKSDELDDNRELQGTVDAGFESSVYNTAKNIITSNAVAKVASDRAHTGKSSFHVHRDNTDHGTVRLYNYATMQKDQYYKLGLWISDAQNGSFDILVANGEQSIPVAAVTIVGDREGKFGYYEYNFRAPIDASHIEFSFTDRALTDVYIDDVTLLHLQISTQEELSLIAVTSVGNGRDAMTSESQMSHELQSDALGQKNTLVGQVFTSQAENLEGVSFFMTQKGDGGINDYAVELREFDENAQMVTSKKLAAHTFSSKDVYTNVVFFPLFAKLEKGKKYWVGINNAGVSVNKDHHMTIGQAGNDESYIHGYGMVQHGEKTPFVRENDLYFAMKYRETLVTGGDKFSYGSMMYDLGNGQGRVDYAINASDGSNILNAYAQNNVSTDKWKNIFLEGDDSYVIYRLGVDQRYIKKITLDNIHFHNNILISLSTDGKKWTDVFADRSGKQWQNSGKIDIDLTTKDTEYVFVKIKRNGDGNSFLLSGQMIVNIVDQHYAQ